MEYPGFPWATLFGIAGTLIGAAVGSWLAHRYAAKQALAERLYQDRTRFHNERLSAYADYLGALTAYMTADNFPEDLSHRLTSTYGRAKLLATEPVRKALTRVFINTCEFHQMGPGDDKNIYHSVIAASVALEEAMKVELGIIDEVKSSRSGRQG